MRHEKIKGRLACIKMGRKSDSQPATPLPIGLPVLNTGNPWEIFSNVTLENRQKLEPNDFVLLTSNGIIAQVQSIWKVENDAPVQSVLLLKKCLPGSMIVHYAMREILVTDEVVCKSVKKLSISIQSKNQIEPFWKHYTVVPTVI
ncbi:uncharacterized protein MELLADRAFT_105643 [Melampsora larici-populina 98AG31]|uniref:Uncharacterized protein n=1 Tax=Melampsora larici-populina (strain 98AG31 / pathotype 3-4-7) TaxID=747676 RepID=F4RIW2_MELLP|nr:uncharacterized protein MELLADRAFT_105643 [Melampsora larici-populina 98AG31]EGG07632.1 hypothetical protein MELLADRAFT_105643 [Melampsora larici-populina 98AG31]